MSHPLLPKNLNKDNALFRQGVPDFSKLDAAAFPVPTDPKDQGAILEVTDTGDRYRWTGSVWVQIETGGADVASLDFPIQVARGKIPGWEGVFLTIQSTTIGASYTDMWDEGGLMTLPTTAETLEIVSSSAADTSAGAGARTVLISSLDASFNRQFTTVTLNGTTPVTITGTHRFFYFAVLLTADQSTSHGSNTGDITVMVASAGAVRGKMPAEEGVTHNSQFMVPAGKSLFPKQFSFLSEKGEDITFRTRDLQIVTDAPQRSAASLPTYQAAYVGPLAVTSGIVEKTIVWFQAKSTNVDVIGTVLAEYFLIDN